MQPCPHCNQALRVKPRAYMNVDAHGSTVLTRTDCCGHGVYVIPRMQYEIQAYHGTRDQDDWAVPLEPITHDNNQGASSVCH